MKSYRLVFAAVLLGLTAAVTTNLDPGTSQLVDQSAVLTGWCDQLGASITNVAVLDLTAATKTGSDWFKPPNPAWCAGAAQFDGIWSKAGWQVPTTAPNDSGTLLLGLNRNGMTNKLWLGLSIIASGSAKLFVDLLDADARPLACELGGNLLADAPKTNLLLSISLADYPAATALVLRRTSGAITVPLVFLALEDSSSNVNSSTTAIQTGQNTAASVLSATSPAGQAFTAPPGVAPVLETPITMSQERLHAAAAMTGTIWYVSSAGGDDNRSGRAQAWNGRHGPFASIAKGVASAKPGDTVIVSMGSYDEEFWTGTKGAFVTVTGEGVFGTRGKKK